MPSYFPVEAAEGPELWNRHQTCTTKCKLRVTSNDAELGLRKTHFRGHIEVGRKKQRDSERNHERNR